eukprot:SAG22_NODE_21808_length_254_cov_0.587097_1_plen_44_part_01
MSGVAATMEPEPPAPQPCSGLGALLENFSQRGFCVLPSLLPADE